MMKQKLIFFLIFALFAGNLFSQSLNKFVIEKESQQGQKIVRCKNCKPESGVIVIKSTIPDLKFKIPRRQGECEFDGECYVLCVQPTDKGGAYKDYNIEITASGYEKEEISKISNVRAGEPLYFKITPKENTVELQILDISRNPLPKCEIKIKGTKNYVYSDSDGKHTVKLPSSGAATLVIAHENYKNKEIIVYPGNKEVVILQELKKSSGSKSTNTEKSFGIKGGLNLSNISNQTKGIDFSGFSTQIKWFGFNAGVLLNIRFGREEGIGGLQPELLYSNQGFVFNSNTINFHYITVPLMAKLYLGGNFNFELGPYFSYLIMVSPNSTVIKTEKYDFFSKSIDLNLSDLKNGKDFGVAVGVGYDFKHLILSARYNHGLFDMAKNLQWKNYVVNVSTGWKF